jgi:gamma-glutamyltranspeptidase/glutathione hydrolase
MFGRRRALGCAVFLMLIAIQLFGHSSAVCAQQIASGKKFVVVSGHPAATAAGMQVLRDGGNVVDSAITTSLCLGVAEPYGSGIGGKGMMLYRDGKTGQVFAIESMCAASQSLDAAEFAKLPQRDRLAGYKAVAVPGLIAGLDAAHARWGSKKWHDVVAPAAALAREGVETTEKMQRLMRPKRNLLRRDAEAARIYLANGETPAIGQVLKFAELAGTLEGIANDGPRTFYEGPVAAAIVRAANDAGAVLTLDDFRSYKPRSTEPLAIEFDERRVYSCPPPLTGGVTVLTMLRALDKVAALDATNGRDPKYFDLVGRLLLSVYPQVSAKIADVPAAQKSANELFGNESVTRIQQDAASIEPANAQPEATETSSLQRDADDFAESSTTHFIVADSEGNIVCMTQSLSFHYGACVVAPGTGVLLNDSMSNFAISDPNAANYVQPGKRERSTIAPIIVTAQGRPLLALGIPGGQRIPTTTIQLLTDILHFGSPLATAFDRPRFHVRRPLSSEEARNVVDIEDDAPPEYDEDIKQLGWQVVRHPRDGSYFGGGSAVQYLPNGSLEAVADLRRTNAADGD